MLLCCFFFFKQKTAYDLRISDWSSDVCSSDLRTDGRAVDNFVQDAVCARCLSLLGRTHPVCANPHSADRSKRRVLELSIPSVLQPDIRITGQNLHLLQARSPALDPPENCWSTQLLRISGTVGCGWIAGNARRFPTDFHHFDWPLSWTHQHSQPR